MMYKGKIIRSPDNIRSCTCVECSECKRMMFQEELAEQNRIWREEHGAESY